MGPMTSVALVLPTVPGAPMIFFLPGIAHHIGQCHFASFLLSASTPKTLLPIHNLFPVFP